MNSVHALANYGTTYGSSYSTTSSPPVNGLFIFITIILLLLVLTAFLISIGLFINAAKEKGHFKHGGTGVLWFVGIFATPIVVGLYTASLPDLSNRNLAQEGKIEEELPAV